MTTFTIRTLECTDTQALLAFESQNREWFESHIDPRAPAFYSEQGIAEHIEGYLADFAVNAWHPFVIENASGTIVGRANLKNINSPQGAAEVGYRIDQRFCGQGLATQALEHLIEQAQAQWHLTQLIAYAYKDNIGSQKVLDKCGFTVEQASLLDVTKKECRYTLSFQ